MQTEIFEGRKGVNFLVGRYKVTTGDMRTLCYKGIDEEHDGWLNDAIVCAFIQYIIKHSVCNNSLNQWERRIFIYLLYIFMMLIVTLIRFSKKIFFLNNREGRYY